MNKIKPVNRALCLIPNLYGRSDDYVFNIEADILSGDPLFQMIADHIHKLDAMSVTSVECLELTTVTNTV